jgi:hypothetical protein
MAKKKFDAVLEAVRLDKDGQLQLARIYDRKGIVFTDHFLVDRDQLIQRLKNGQLILSGKRQPKMGSLFDTGEEVRLITTNGKDVLVVGSGTSDRDQFDKIPRF